MSILQSHHVIEQSVFSKNDLLQVLVAGGFDRDGSKNRIYLPVDNDLAEEVGSSPHRGRTLSSYNLMSMSLVESIMDTAAGKLVMSGDSDPDALHQVAHKVNELQDTLKDALNNSIGDNSARFDG